MHPRSQMDNEGFVARLPRNRPPWVVIREIAREIWSHAMERVGENLTLGEGTEFRTLIRKSKGRRMNLTDRERDRLVFLVKKAATGEGASSWGTVATSLPDFLPPRIVAGIWSLWRKRR
jgi:hypothetical protein